MLAHKTPEPLAQAPGLIRHLVEFARKRARANALECIGRQQLRLLQPAQQSLAVIDPVDRGFDRRRDRIQEIQSGRVADKNRGRRRGAGSSQLLFRLQAASRLIAHP